MRQTAERKTARQAYAEQRAADILAHTAQAPGLGSDSEKAAHAGAESPEVTNYPEGAVIVFPVPKAKRAKKKSAKRKAAKK